MSGSEASFKQQLSDSLWRSTILPETVEVVSINSSVRFNLNWHSNPIDYAAFQNAVELQAQAVLLLNQRE